MVGFASKKPHLKTEYHIVFLNKIILVFIPVASIIVEYCIYTSNNSYKATIASVFMILINVLVFYIFDNIVEMSFKIRENENIETMNKAYEKQLEIIKNNDEKTAVLRHDFKNQMAKLYELIEEDNEKAREHIERISEHITAKGNYSDSGNKNIDSFLNYKFAEFESIKCDIDCNIMIPADIDLNPFEMTALLGNLLDNALRALQNIEKPYIIFNMSYSKNVVKISVKNPYDGNIIQNGNEFTTTKKDKYNHGKGLNIVKNIVKKYDGETRISTNNNIFSVNICFFLNYK
jgi:sensor histidine kinase regulating citrate/malate metabolism